MVRDQVIDAIDGEREYQTDQAQLAASHVIPDISLGDTLLAIHYNYNLARDAWYNGTKPHEETMHFVRKIAALAVQAGEKYGMPRREGY